MARHGSTGAGVAALAICAAAPGQWREWGGPNRDFALPDVELTADWAAAPPVVAWRRELGNGTSGVVVDGETAYTMAGKGKREWVVALDTDSGEPRWRHEYSVGFEAGNVRYGGPHSTPLIAGDRLVTVGIDSKVHAFDRATGEVSWRRDLVVDFHTDLPQSGYAASPLRWRDLVLLPGCGAPGFGAIALRLGDGATVWARHSFASSHASPILVRSGGRDHAVFHGMNRLVGLDPATGDLLWHHRLRTDAVDNVAFSPILDAGRDLLLVSHAYDGVGTRALRLIARDGSFAVEPAWSNRRLKVEHGNGAIVDATLIASDGSEPAFTVGIDLRSGATRFKQRGLPKASYVAAGDKLLVLDERGVLHLARTGRDGLTFVGRKQLLAENAWTAPTLVGRRVYARDRFHIIAVDLP